MDVSVAAKIAIHLIDIFDASPRKYTEDDSLYVFPLSCNMGKSSISSIYLKDPKNMDV